MTNQQRDTTVIVSLLLAWSSSWTNSWVASHESSMLMVIRSRESSPFTTAQWCLFNVNQKRAFEQIVKFYNEHCVWRECRKCPFHRYWILIIPWFLNKQTDCITFPMNIVVDLKKLLNKQVSSLNKKSEFVWTKCHLSSNKYILAYLHRKPYGSCQGVIYSFGRRLLTICVRSNALMVMTTKTLYQWCSLCQCWSWSPNHCANDDQRSTLPVAHKFLSNQISTSAKQPVQFYTNHTSTAAQQPDNFQCITTAWLEQTLAKI